jgi:NADPH-dependent 2,4-dienoyl-CoA reductase/sulfur reductase-like enzyme
MMDYDIVIIGAGPAGMAAAIEAKRSGAGSVLVIDRDIETGGILNQCIHSGFGLHMFSEELTGPEYAERYSKALKESGAHVMLDTMVMGLQCDGREKTVRAINPVSGIMEIQAKAVILAMGCRERTRGAIQIPGDRPSGVLTAGTAQRYVNSEGYRIGKKAVVLGSGDIGLIMARRLTLEGAKVLACVEIMPYSSGLNRNIVQCLDDFSIPLLLSHTVTRIVGRRRLEGVVIAEVDSERKPVAGTERFVECDTLLLSVGLIPENEITDGAGIELDPRTRGPFVDGSMETSMEGIFACGNVVHVNDLADHVSLEGERAGRSAAEYVRAGADAPGRQIGVLAGTGVSYIVPQHLSEGISSGTTELSFRADRVFKNAYLIVRSESGAVLKKVRRPRITPGEMERISVRNDIIDNAVDITISIEEV